MSTRVVVGAGSTGMALARLLAGAGDTVRLVTRRGTGPDHPMIEPVAADATDSDRLTELTQGADTVFQCAMPAYDRWPADFPPLADAVLTATARAGADYVMLGNAYGYGPVDGPVRADRQLAPTTVKGVVRQRIWQGALAVHEQGRVRVTEVRGSDYLGRGAGSPYTLAVLPQVLAGKPAGYPGDPDAPHSWTYTGDAASTLAAAASGDRSWGRAWHVPSQVATARELTDLFVKLAGAPSSQLTELPATALAAAGADDPVVAELIEMRYLMQRPFVLDSADTEAVLGVTASPLDDAVRETIDPWRMRSPLEDDPARLIAPGSGSPTTASRAW